MAYKVKEIYYTLQGEGFYTGHPAVFCRFTGCNLWSGREEDRFKAICQFCDTDFIGTDGELGGRYSAKILVETIKNLWPSEEIPCFVVFTGGEPGLQLDQNLVEELHRNNCYIAIETNGTVNLPDNLDWICVSPKANTELIIKKGNELKLVFPQEELQPAQFEKLDFEHLYLQPMDSESVEENTQAAVKYCRANPQWKLSIQTHKILGIQ